MLTPRSLFAACLAREAKGKETHEKDLAACLAREAEEKQTHEQELANCKDQKAQAEKAYKDELAACKVQKAEAEKELAFKNEQISEILPRYQALHASYEGVCTRVPNDGLICSLKSEIAELKNRFQLQVSLYSFLAGVCDLCHAARP